MIRVVNEESNILGFNKGGEDYTVEIDVCKNPYCSCGIVDLMIRSDKDAPNTESIQIMLDNAEKDLLFDMESKISPFLKKKANQIIDYLNEHLREDDWELLAQSSDMVKGDYVEFDEYSLEEWGYIMPEEHLIDQDAFVPIHDIFPGIEFFSVSDGTDDFVFEDSYCKKRDCDCTIVKFELLKNENKIASLEYNFGTGEMSSSKYNELIGDFLFAFYPLGMRVQNRHDKIKAVFEKVSFKNKLKKIIPQNEKIGRNDPCSCGSGKKFKDCCGNNVISINRNN